LPENADGQRVATFQIAGRKFDFIERREREERFRWMPLENLKEEDLSLPIDQEVVSGLKKEFQSVSLLSR